MARAVYLEIYGYGYVQLRTCNGAEYQVKIFLSMPIYAFHGAILGVISAGGYAVYCYLNGVHNYLHR